MPADPLLWLLGDEAASLLAEAAESPVDPASVSRLRKQLGDSPSAAAKVAAVLELTELRWRAAVKFPYAARMFFTRKGYEQATDAVVARYKAERFAKLGRVVDACCGIGGDLIALADAANDCVGIDADPVIAAYAERNVRECGRSATVESYELAANNLPGCDAWHVDPDRRPAGRRTTDPASHEPSLATLESW
ncbi:MAG: SAM-dependent methyltransferase, partial [Planctomycetota bacterium]